MKLAGLKTSTQTQDLSGKQKYKTPDFTNFYITEPNLEGQQVIHKSVIICASL